MWIVRVKFKNIGSLITEKPILEYSNMLFLLLMCAISIKFMQSLYLLKMYTIYFIVMIGKYDFNDI